MGEGAHTCVESSCPPTPPALDLCIYLACDTIGCHVELFPQTLPPRFVDTPDCIVLCSPISDSTLVVHEDQVVDGVSVMQPTCIVIHDECVQGSKEEPLVKDDLPLFAPHHSTLASLVILPFMIFPVKTYCWMFLRPIIHKTHRMSVYHCFVVMTYISFKIVFHLSFLET